MSCLLFTAQLAFLLAEVSVRSWGLSLIRPVTDCLLCGFHVSGGSNTGGNLLFPLFLFWVFFPGKLF